MSYVNTYSLTNKSAINFLNDAQLLWYYVSTGNGNQPSILNKDYNNFYEFILTSGEKKVLILENIITSDLINLITNNDKTLLKKVYISNNCEVIDSDCFNGCSNLIYVSYTNVENNASVSSLQ